MTTRIPTTVTVFVDKEGNPYLSVADATCSDSALIDRIIAVTGAPRAEDAKEAANGMTYAVAGRCVLVNPAFRTRVREDGTTRSTLVGFEGVEKQTAPASLASFLGK